MDPVAALTSIKAEVEQGSTETPIYRRLKSALEQAILSNRLRAGEHLPGERKIAEALALSRVTVRKALELLETEGLLARQHGVRTEIGSKVEKTMSTLTSFSEDLRARGMEPGFIWISKEIGRPTSTEAMALGVAGNGSVARLKRVRTADSQPIAVEVATVPTRFLPSPDHVETSLYEVLNARGFLPQRAMQRMRAGAANTADASHLKCAVGAPLLVTERRCFMADGQIVEFCETRYRGDVYDFVFELQK